MRAGIPTQVDHATGDRGLGLDFGSFLRFLFCRFWSTAHGRAQVVAGRLSFETGRWGDALAADVQWVQWLLV